MSAKSIAYVIFKEEVTKILGSMYFSLTSFEITQNTLESSLTENRKILDIYDNIFPFSYFNVSFEEYKRTSMQYKTKLFERTIVDLITITENYCYDALTRIFVLNPDLFKSEEAKTSFSEIYTYIDGRDIYLGLCENLVQHKLRNKKTTEMLKEIGKYAKSGYTTSLEEDFNKIDMYSLIRNSIVHNNSLVTNDILKKGYTQFNSLEQKIPVDHQMCVDLSRSMLSLIEAFEVLYNENIIKDNDACALICEMYIEKGYEMPSVIKPHLNRILGVKIENQLITSSIAKIRRDRPLLQYIHYQDKTRRIVSAIK